MGAVVASMELENAVDRGMSAQGLRDESTVRRTRVDGIVDTGAVTLVLPQNVVERLGLATQRTVIVTCADERKEERPVAGPVTVRTGDRFMSTDAIVGPPLSEPLIGQVILEVLDLIADRAKQALYPRVPDYPLLNLKRLRAACPKTGRDGRSTPPRPRAAEALRACLLYRACPEGEAAVRAMR